MSVGNYRFCVHDVPARILLHGGTPIYIFKKGENKEILKTRDPVELNLLLLI
jgi:hypothetical protein